MTSATTKYWVIAGLTAATSILTYLQGQPAISEDTIIGAAILVVGLIIHDYENQPDGSTVVPPAQPVQTTSTA